jgi:hypothetical protein
MQVIPKSSQNQKNVYKLKTLKKEIKTMNRNPLRGTAVLVRSFVLNSCNNRFLV